MHFFDLSDNEENPELGYFFESLRTKLKFNITEFQKNLDAPPLDSKNAFSEHWAQDQINVINHPLFFDVHVQRCTQKEILLDWSSRLLQESKKCSDILESIRLWKRRLLEVLEEFNEDIEELARYVSHFLSAPSCP